MKSANELRTNLRAIDHKSYPAYKSLAGAYQFGSYVMVIDHVQGDPFASPSSLHLEIGLKETGFPERLYERDSGRIALQDHLARRFAAQVEEFNFKAKGSGKSGLISITKCGQEVLERSACQIVLGKTIGMRRKDGSSEVRNGMSGNGAEGKIIVRFHVGFPAFGRTINAGELEKILFDFLPKCVENSFFYRKLDAGKVEQAVFLAEDQEAVREILKKEKLAAFVANGAILPRRSGVSDLPMKDSVAFVSPKSLERTFRLPHRGEIKGMAVPQGITLIVGGGYHGKSTLLDALQMGAYDHVAGDGREFVITDDTAVKLRAEDGRSIRDVDISLFINDLPNRKDTKRFSTMDASGSTSQAAGVVESMEAGAGVFLIDEDTSATNFMVRDDFMQQVISREKEPITPFLERARELYEKAGISTILVAGSSGAFFYIADVILQMDCYRPVDITGRVKEMCRERKAPRVKAPGFEVPDFAGRSCGGKRGTDAAAGKAGWRGGRGAGRGAAEGGNADRRSAGDEGGRHEMMKVKTMGRDGFTIDREMVDLRYVEQLADSEQTSGLAYLLRYSLEHAVDGRASVQQVVDMVYGLLERKGWEPFCGSYVPCGLAKPRKQEFYACLNRFRG